MKAMRPSQKTKTLKGKNAHSAKHSKYSLKAMRKKYHEAYADNHINRPLFYVGLKEDIDGFKKGDIYPAYMIESGEVGEQQKGPSALEKLMIDKYGKLTPEEMELKKKDAMNTLDEDDMEYLEENTTEDEPEVLTIVWLFIANQKNGLFGWVDSNLAFYLT